MIWKKDRFKPTQPYFVFDTQNFKQEVYLSQGISHFYTFEIDGKTSVRIVPDGCIDLVFVYGNEKMQSYACGTRLEHSYVDLYGKNEMFGVRFMPGVQPNLLTLSMKNLLDKMVPLENIINGTDEWLELMASEKDFYQRIRIFIEYYTKAEKRRSRLYGKKELVQSVKNLVYETDGKIKVQDMQERTGYTDRYINKVFIEEMGFSPKVFCKIIQFQRALEFLHYGAPDKMTDAAVYLGYYDQPQFIRDFKKFAGITPKKYLKLVNEYNYRSHIEQTEYLK